MAATGGRMLHVHRNQANETPHSRQLHRLSWQNRGHGYTFACWKYSVPTSAQHTVSAELNRVRFRIAGVRLVERANTQRAHLVAKSGAGKVAERCATSHDLNTWRTAFTEIRLGLVDNRADDLFEALYQLAGTFLAERLVWQRWPPTESDVYLCHYEE